MLACVASTTVRNSTHGSLSFSLPRPFCACINLRPTSHMYSTLSLISSNASSSCVPYVCLGTTCERVTTSTSLPSLSVASFKKYATGGGDASNCSSSAFSRSPSPTTPPDIRLSSDGNSRRSRLDWRRIRRCSLMALYAASPS